MAPPSKRPLASSQASSQPSATPASKPRPTKRARRDEPELHQSTRIVAAAAPHTRLAPDEATKHPLPEPRKRVHHPGTLRRLSSGRRRPSSSRPPRDPTHGGKDAAPLLETRPNATLSGNRIGGKSKDLADGVRTEEIWVTARDNKKNRRRQGDQPAGAGFSAWLKRGVGAFVERGCTCLKIHAMGASIPTALTLSLAIRDAVPGGSPLAASVVDASVDDASDLDEETRDDETGRARGSAAGIFKMEVRTGTSVVGDEITPEDDDEDMVYQTRSKSTVEVTLTLDDELGKLVGIGPRLQQGKGHASTRGGKRRRGAGTRGGSGRGRG